MSKILLFSTILIIFILLGLYIWLKQRVYNVVDKEIYNHLVENIRVSEDLPERFYEIYGQVTEFDENSTTNKFIFFRLLQGDSKPCPCVNASYGVVFNTIDTWSVGISLDKDVLPKKCLDFYLSRLGFPYSIIGIQNASQFYYKKDLEELSDNEMLELSVMTINSFFYNKIRNPDRLKEEVEKIKMNQK